MAKYICNSFKLRDTARKGLSVLSASKLNTNKSVQKQAPGSVKAPQLRRIGTVKGDFHK